MPRVLIALIARPSLYVWKSDDQVTFPKSPTLLLLTLLPAPLLLLLVSTNNRYYLPYGLHRQLSENLDRVPDGESLNYSKDLERHALLLCRFHAAIKGFDWELKIFH